MKNLQTIVKPPLVSVIIPTYEREKCLVNLLERLVDQDYDNYEIIVIDQSKKLAGDKLRSFNADHQNILRLFHIHEKGRPLAKNYGILQARGSILLFCDDDIVPPNNFISTHAISYDDPDIGAVSCRLVEEGQVEMPLRSPLKITWYGRLVNRPYSTQSGYVTSLNGGNMSMRGEAVLKSGYFEESFVGTSMVEEPDFAYRIIKNGYKIFFNASIRVMHYPQNNGNTAMMNKERGQWFNDYFHNLMIFFVKYKRYPNMPFLFFYFLFLSIKHVIKYKLTLKDFIHMFQGLPEGFKTGLKLQKGEKSKYYANFRIPKTNIEPLDLR